MLLTKRSTVMSIIVCIALSLPAFAQSRGGEVNGTITDSTGAVVPGATVTLTNQATNIQTHVNSNNSGYFIFLNVQPGTYEVSVEKPGFNRGQIPNFQVGVSQTLTQNFQLTPGAVATTVEVTAQAPLVDNSTTELGTVIETRAVNDLPLNGRNFTQLLTLTPGVTPVSTSQNRNLGCCEGNVGIPGSGFSDGSFHGQNNRSKLYFFDGIINTNVRGPTYIVIPNLDLVQEFKVVGHDAKAEFGGASGGVVNLVSKSGGNTFHGSAFEYVRNNFFDARDTFADGPTGCTLARCKPGQLVPSGPAAFHQNQFGAAVTGPIIKNKTFFSAGYDGWRYSKPDQALSYVPTVAEIAGDFTNTSGAFKKQIYNPYSTRAVGANFQRDPFYCSNGAPIAPDPTTHLQQPLGTGLTPPAGVQVCNIIPQALIFAPMQQFFQTYSAVPNIVDPTGKNNFVRDRATLNNSNAYIARIDHHFRDADVAFFRYTEQRNTVFTPIGEAGSTSGGSQGRNYGGGWTHMFSPTLILDVRAGYAGRPGVDAGQQNTHTAGVDALKKAGFKDVDKYNGLLIALSPNTNWTNGGNNNFGIRGSAPRENPNWSLTPGLSWLKGRHNIKTGGWYINAKRIQLNTFQTYTFSDEQSRNPSVNNTGLALASALLGFPSSFTAQLPIPHGGPVEFGYASWAAYLQDEWKIAPTLTLTAGLRYDYVTQPHTLDGRLWNSLDLANQQYIIGAATMPPLCTVAGQAPCIPNAAVPNAPQGFLNDPFASHVVLAGKDFFAPPPIKDNWGPRVGIAWQFTPKTVMRAGYGLYWDPLTARSQYAQNDLEAMVWPDAVAFNGTANACTNGGSCAFTNGTAINIIQQQGLGFATPIPTYTSPGAGKPTTGLPWNGFPNQGDDPKFKDGYSHQWNFEIQRELSPTMMVSVAYAGSRSERLPYGAGNANAANQAFPNGTPASVVDAARQMPWVTAGLTYSRSIGEANYHALESRFQKRFSHGLQTLVSYTWGKSTDTGSGYFNVENGPGGGSTIQNYYDMNTARGQSSYNIPHFLSWATVYELPAGKGKGRFDHGITEWLLGDWQANYIFQARSGAPYNLQVSGDVANLRGSAPGAPGTYARPNLLADPFAAGPVAANPDPACQKTISQGGKAADATHSIASWFNPCAFGVPSGAFGNLGRNAFNGPHVVNMDFSMFKNIPIRESMSVQLRFEAFNVFNIQNYDTPANAQLTINSGTVPVNGVPVPAIATAAGSLTQLAQGSTPRQMQFGLRFIF